VKKSFFILFVFYGILGLTSLQLFAVSEKFELKTTEATLMIDQKGILKVIQNKRLNVRISTSLNNLWKIVLKSNLNNKEYEFTPGKNYSIIKSDDIIRLTVNYFSAESKTIPAKAELTISVKDMEM
jgi:hypothetical protein